MRHAEKGAGEHVLALDEKSNGSDKATSAGSFDGPVQRTPSNPPMPRFLLCDDVSSKLISILTVPVDIC